MMSSLLAVKVPVMIVFPVIVAVPSTSMFVSTVHDPPMNALNLTPRPPEDRNAPVVDEVVSVTIAVSIAATLATKRKSTTTPHRPIPRLAAVAKAENRRQNTTPKISVAVK
jgi:hypothetical protein